jgi:hypothetical protein
MQHPKTGTWNNYINKRNLEWSLESLFWSAYEFLAAYSLAKMNRDQVFEYNDDGDMKSAYTEKNTEMINWWLTYSKTGKRLITLLGEIEKRIPMEGVPQIRKIWEIPQPNITADLHNIFISTLFNYYLSWVMDGDVPREKKEKAIILFKELGFKNILGTDQEMENVQRRLGMIMRFDDLI